MAEVGSSVVGGEVVGRYPLRRYAEELVEEFRRDGIAATIIRADRRHDRWEVAVPAGDAVRARLIAEGLLGY